MKDGRIHVFPGLLISVTAIMVAWGGQRLLSILFLRPDIPTAESPPARVEESLSGLERRFPQMPVSSLYVPSPTNDPSFLSRDVYVSNAWAAAWQRFPGIMRWPTNRFCIAPLEPYVCMADLSNAHATVHVTIERGGPTNGNQATPPFHTMQTVRVEMDKAGRVLAVKKGAFYDDLVDPAEVRR